MYHEESRKFRSSRISGSDGNEEKVNEMRLATIVIGSIRYNRPVKLIEEHGAWKSLAPESLKPGWT